MGESWGLHEILLYPIMYSQVKFFLLHERLERLLGRPQLTQLQLKPIT